MRNLILLVISAFLFLLSCKKHDPAVTADNTLSASVNGISENFNLNVKASYTKFTGSVNSLDISGSSADSGTINILIQKTGIITKGTYAITAPSFDASNQTVITYYKGYGDQLSPNLKASSSNSITITYISDTVVQGTFNVGLTGYYAPSTAPVVDNKIFTNGKFNLSIKQ